MFPSILKDRSLEGATVGPRFSSSPRNMPNWIGMGLKRLIGSLHHLRQRPQGLVMVFKCGTESRAGRAVKSCRCSGRWSAGTSSHWSPAGPST